MRALSTLLVMAFACAPGWSADWLTDGGDSKRTAWQRDETIFTKKNVGATKLLWTIRLDNKPRQMHSLFPPLIVDRVDTRNGPKQIAVVAGVSDNLYAIDVETGKLLWKKHFDNNWTEQPGRRPAYVLCPGGITGHAGHRAQRDARQVYDLRRLLGRQAAASEHGRR